MRSRIPRSVIVLALGLVSTIADPRLGTAATLPPGAALLLESDAGITTDGSNRVTGWLDQSGNGHHASQAVEGGRPLLVNNVLNGLPALRFDGSTDFLGVAGQVITSQQFSIFAVVNDTETTGLYREVFSNWDPANTTTSVFLGSRFVNPSLIRTRFTDQMGGAADGQAGVGVLDDPTSHFIFTGISGASDALIYQDQALIAQEGGPLSARILNTPYVIGRQGALNGEHWQGDIAALIVYDRELSAAERGQVWNYLGVKYFAVPEPGSAALTGLGVSAMIVVGVRRRRGRAA